MLLKFNSVEEIGRFKKLTHKAEPLAKLSLIFGRNGYGKSTLCAILRSATDGRPEHITSRRRLGTVEDSRVETLWSSGSTFTYSATKWNGSPGKIYIFDQDYVSKNLHVADSVTRDNKRSLLPVVLGAHGVGLAENVVALDREQREMDGICKAESRIILAQCKGVPDSKISDFCKAPIPDDLNDQIHKSLKRLELARQANIVKIRTNPKQLSLGDLFNVDALLAETVADISENATNLVNQHLEGNKLGVRAQAWLEYGTNHSSDAHCPFCAQETKGLPLLNAYRIYFSETFKSLQSRIDGLLKLLDHMLSASVCDVIAANDVDFAFWIKVCDLPSLPTLTDGDLATVNDGLSQLKSLVSAKLSNPLEIISLGASGTAISQAISILKSYNEDVASSISVIDKVRLETEVADLRAAEAVYLKWLAMEEKANEPVKTAIGSYLSSEARLEKIKVEKATAQTALTNYTTATMAARQEAVNHILADFSANFRIVDAKTNFVGREPNTEFAIEIGAQKVKAGDKSETEPSFKTVLSAGDKTTLALAFFIAQIKADPDLNNAVVVFDDPFNSQDLDRQFQTTSYIRSICNDASQTIVLSHDPRFLQNIEKNADKGSIRTFQLQCSDAGVGALEVWSSKDELKSLYVEQSEIIREYAAQKKVLKGQTLNSIHQSIRPFLEDYLRLRFPGRFPDQAQIFEMTNVIGKSGQSDPLSPYVNDLLALNEYTRTNMHGGGTVPDPVELRAHCRKVVNIIGSY